MKFISDFFKKEKTPEEYIEVDINKDIGKKSKIVVRPFVLKSFEDVNFILEVLREGYTIALIDIKMLRNKDIVELKRAVAKLRKTVEALEGSLAGFGENVLIATPSFAKIYRAEPQQIERIDGSAGGSSAAAGPKGKVEKY